MSEEIGSAASTRRSFLKTSGAVAAGLAASSVARAQAPAEKLAVLGGPKAVTVPFKDADRWPLYGAEEEQAVVQLLRNPGYAPNQAFEEDWKAYYKAPYVKNYFNGTSALAAMFFGLNLPPGSEIMVPSYTFFATIVPMRLFGLVPVFVDVDRHTMNLSVEDARKRLTKNTKAILPVHWIGNPCDMEAVCDFAKEKGLIVLEDCAHSHGATLNGKLTGTFGTMSIFSFQQTKPLPGIEGGMGMYKEREHYERATTFGHYDAPKTFGEDSEYRQFAGSGLGLKLRMHPVAAVLARIQLKSMDRRNADGAAQVRSLNEQILELPGLYQQKVLPKAQRIYYSWNMLFIDEKEAGMSRAAAVKALKAEGVHIEEHKYSLQHKLALYRKSEYWHHLPEIPELPRSEELLATAMGLPYFTSPVPELVEQYAKAFRKVWAHRKELPST